MLFWKMAHACNTSSSILERWWRLLSCHYNQMLYCLGKVQEADLPILTSKRISLTVRWKVFGACSALLHGSETGALAASDLQRLRRNDRSIFQWICGVKPNDEISIDLLCARIQVVTAALRSKRLRCYGHVVRSSSCIKSCHQYEGFMLKSARETKKDMV